MEKKLDELRRLIDLGKLYREVKKDVAQDMGITERSLEVIYSKGLKDTQINRMKVDRYIKGYKKVINERQSLINRIKVNEHIVL